MNHMKKTWISISISIAAVYGCKAAQNSEELAGRGDEIGTCYAICSSNREFWCGTLESPLTKSDCVNYDVASIQPPIPGFRRFEWEAGGRPRPRGGVDVPGQGESNADIIEKSSFVCQISRSEKLYFNIQDQKAYYEDFSKPEILEESTLNKAKNMDPYSFSFSALADKYAGTTRDPGFPGKPGKPIEYVLLELTRPTKRSAICNLSGPGMPQGLPQPMFQ